MADSGHALDNPAFRPRISRLLTDCGGRIDELALSVGPVLLTERAAAVAFRAAFSAFAATLDEAMLLRIVTQQGLRDPVAALVDGWRPRCRVEIADVAPPGAMTPLSVWTQDSFLVGGDDAPGLVEIRSENGNRHASWLSASLGCATTSEDVYLSGGNVLVGDGFALVGSDSVQLSHSGPGAGDGLARIEATIGLPVQVIGPECGVAAGQPDFHIDRIVSLTGLRDPDGLPILLVARPVPEATDGWTGARRLGDTLDAIASQLETSGFRVLRNPAPNAPMPGTIDRRLRAYNNVLVDNASTLEAPAGRVWLPCFADAEPSLAEIEAENLEIWRSLGFEVRRAPGWTPLAAFGGALRCAVKVLRRTAEPPAHRPLVEPARRMLEAHPA